MKNLLVSQYKALVSLDAGRKFLLILILGLAVRFFFMPIAGHDDILRSYERSYAIAFEGVDIFSYGQEMTHGISALFLKLYDVFLEKAQFPPFDMLTHEFKPNINVNLFLYKVPYLLFDIGCLFLLKALIGKSKQALYSIAFYFLNPILIFAVYIYGRYETFPLLFVLAALVVFKQKKFLLSAFLFGLSVMTRQSFLMLVPIYVMLGGRTLIEKAQMGILSVLPFAFGTWYKSNLLDTTKELEWLSTGYHSDFLFNTGIELRSQLFIYPFFLLYGLLAFWALRVWADQRTIHYKVMAGFFTLVFLLYYAAAYVRPPYYAWVIPFLAITLLHKNIRTWILLLFGVFTICFVYYLLYWRPPTHLLYGLFHPLGEHIGTQYAARGFDKAGLTFRVIGLARTGMSATAVILMYYQIKQILKDIGISISILQVKRDD